MSRLKNQRKNQRGQVVIEYVLLLVVGVAIAAIITKTMVSRSPDSQGFLIVKWAQILTVVGADYPD
jgi:hypothetical protein